MNLTNQSLVYTINNNTTSNTGINWNNLSNITLMETYSPDHVKKYEVIETTEDLLALSTTWYRLRNNNVNVGVPEISTLLSEKLFQRVTEEDRIKANEIRDYYSKKLMVMTLKEMKLTTFRKDLAEYLNGDSRKFTEKTLPMVYRLPEFHERDVQFDKVKTSFKLEIPNLQNFKKIPVTLYPVITFKKTNIRGKFIEYWMKDENDYAYRFALQHFDALLGLWEKEFSKPYTKLEVNVIPKRQDDLTYLQITSIS